MNGIKRIEYEKIISKNEMVDVIISKWYKPVGHNIAYTTIELTPLKVNLTLIFSKFKDFKKFIKEHHNSDIEHENCNAMYIQVKEEGIVWHYVLIQENEWLAEHYGTICHELHHLTHGLLQEKGVTYGENGEEIYAYVQGYFMEMVVRAFIELKKSKFKLLDK